MQDFKNTSLKLNIASLPKKNQILHTVKITEKNWISKYAPLREITFNENRLAATSLTMEKVKQENRGELQVTAALRINIQKV